MTEQFSNNLAAAIEEGNDQKRKINWPKVTGVLRSMVKEAKDLKDAIKPYRKAQVLNTFADFIDSCQVVLAGLWRRDKRLSNAVSKLQQMADDPEEPGRLSPGLMKDASDLISTLNNFSKTVRKKDGLEVFIDFAYLLRDAEMLASSLHQNKISGMIEAVADDVEEQ